MLKTCNACGVPKPLDEFHTRKGGRRRAQCKVCTRAKMRAYDAGRRDVKAAYNERYYADNAEVLRQRQADRQARNPFLHRERARRWRKANPERMREHAALGRQRRRAAVARAGVYTVTEKDVRRLVARHRGLCAYCGERPWEHLDHIVPIARGGRHAIGNLLPACARCNLTKYVRLLIEWKYGRRAKRAVA